MPSDKRARQRERRDQKKQEEAKQQRRDNLRRSITRYAVIVAIALGVFYLISLRGGDETPQDVTATTQASATTTTLATVPTEAENAAPTSPESGPANYDGFRAQTTACGADQPPERVAATFDAPADMGRTGTVTATITTSCGDIVIALDADTYPETVNSFVFLAEEGYFNGTACHRLADGFVLQCGDPDATGRGGPGYTIADEFPDEGFVYDRGVVAMANAGAGTTGSQFFIVIGDGSFLPPTFSILGSVEGSEDALAALRTVTLGVSPSGEQSSPLQTIYIDTVNVDG